MLLSIYQIQHTDRFALMKGGRKDYTVRYPVAETTSSGLIYLLVFFCRSTNMAT